ncbi:MAG: hypothetical protein NZ529_09185 [Cytophagaceae bacterium]|nr:hypothetical protein [Cytophagaceae bacterium]MDW8456957.1 hypothetical protein [Cytophagaceae bacterium]
MKTQRQSVFILIVFFALSTVTSAQPFSDAASYITYISQQYEPIMEGYMSYHSAIAHGKSARKVDNRRQELITKVKEAIKKLQALHPFNGDKSLRDSTLNFFKIYNIVLNEDYAKILNMEEIAEQSYDAMEAYLLAQDKATEKLKIANQQIQNTQADFAKKNNVTLIEGKNTELEKKVLKTAQVNTYYRSVYLIFFKSYKQELYMLDAIEKKNINAIEQNRNALLKFSEEGLKKLDTMRAFNNDISLINACAALLKFYKDECNNSITLITEFYIKEENFMKMKKNIEAKKPNERTQKDVDDYNNAVNEFNKAVSVYNERNKELLDRRNTLIEAWNKASQNFLDRHTPKYK